MLIELSKNSWLLKITILVIFVVGIGLWQKGIDNYTLTDKYTRTDSSGLLKNSAEAFTYFYYYLDLYPVWTVYTPKIYSEEGARQIFTEQAESLMMDHSSYILWGEHGKTLLLLFDAYLNGSAEDITVTTFNIYFFGLSLMLLFVVFYLIRMPLLGFILVGFLGSNPYQLYEVYIRENIFSLAISVLIFLLAVNLPLLKDVIKDELKLKRYLFFAAIFSGFILGTMAHIRAEALSIILSCIVVYIFVPRL